MNNQNLLKGNPATEFRSGREAVENGKKGGLQLGENNRIRKTMRVLFVDMLDSPEKDPNKIKEAIENANLINYTPEEITNAVIMTASILNKAKGGDLKAIEFIRDTIGEKPINRTEEEVKPYEFTEEDEEMFEEHRRSEIAQALKEAGYEENRKYYPLIKPTKEDEERAKKHAMKKYNLVEKTN